MRIRCVVVFTGCFLLDPHALVAQTVLGRVLDADTRQPVAAAELKLMRAERVVATSSSDSLGRFTLRTSSGGRYRIDASRLGYADATTQPIELALDQTIDAVLLLSVTAVPVAALTVVAARDPYLEAAGFYERMRIGNGFYLTESQISRRSTGTIVDVLAGARGVKVQRVNARQEVYLTSPGCLPQIVLDGVMVRWGGPIRGTGNRSAAASQPLEELVRVGHIEGIEIYRAFNGVPLQYVGPNAHCGTILIWTRHR